MTKTLAIAAGVLVVLLGISGWMLKASYEANGALEVKLAGANAVIAQREADMKLSALVVAQLQGRIDQINNTVAPTIREIRYVPVTSTCGPSVSLAATGVQQLLRADPGRPPAGREPAAAVQSTGKPTR